MEDEVIYKTNQAIYVWNESGNFIESIVLLNEDLAIDINDTAEYEITIKRKETKWQ